jgi:hypothetical protein
MKREMTRALSMIYNHKLKINHLYHG